jgi:CheY-like chemotaxis protein
MFGIQSTQAKDQMVSMFDALGAGKITGLQVDDMLSDMSAKLGVTKDAMVPLVKEFTSMGITSQDALEKMTTAALSAKALAGGADAGAQAFSALSKKIQLAGETGQGLKIPIKGLGSLAEMGLTVDDVAKKMGASSVKDALGLMPNLTPDVVVSDIAMPELSGYDLLREVAAVEIAEPLSDRLAAWFGPFSGVGRLFTSSALELLRRETGVPESELQPIDHIGRLRAPLLLIAGADDPYTTLAESEALYAQARSPKSFWLIAGAGHEDLHAFAPEQYQWRVGGFLARLLRRDGTEAVTDSTAHTP